MHVLANWIAKLVQFLYCSIIYHADCNSGLLVLQVDLFVHSSGPFGGPFSDWGGSSEPREPPLATALCKYPMLGACGLLSTYSSDVQVQVHADAGIEVGEVK